MSDPNDKHEAADDLDDLDLDLELELEPEADAPEAVADLDLPALAEDEHPSEHGAVDSTAVAAAAVGAALVAEPAPAAAPSAPSTPDVESVDPTRGTWVWQFGAPPPPPSFGAKFFSGNALGELYRFFGCALLVFIGCLLPWRGTLDVMLPDTGIEAVGGADAETLSTAVETLMPGYSIASGAVSMVIALWLLFASLYGIYSGRQKILPVFLMLEPAFVSWSRTLASWDTVADVPWADKFTALWAHAGTGVLLTLLGSTIVAVQLVLVTVKVSQKTPEEKDKAAARAAKKATRGGGDKPAKAPKAAKAPKTGKAGKSEKTDKPGKSKADAGDGDDAKTKGRRGRKR